LVTERALASCAARGFACWPADGCNGDWRRCGRALGALQHWCGHLRRLL